MTQLIQSPVVFDEEAHRYHLGDCQLSGITSLIHKVLGLGNYPDANEWVRNFAIPRAAEYGTSVHHAIQQYDQLGIKVTLHPKSPRFCDGGEPFWDVSEELEGYIRSREGYTPVANEYTVSDCVRYASQIDNVWEKDGGGIWLIDTKTNNVKLFPGGEAALRLYLSWQLSCYAYMFERQNPGLKVEGLACNWLHKGESAFWQIERRTDEEVARLLSVEWAFIDGRIVYDSLPPEEVAAAQTAISEIPGPSGLIVPEDVIDGICTLIRQKEEAEAKVAELKATLREAMDNAGIKSWDSGRFKATIAADSTATTFDSRRFKADHPDLYKEYTKQTAKKGGFTIALREEK